MKTCCPIETLYHYAIWATTCSELYKAKAVVHLGLCQRSPTLPDSRTSIGIIAMGWDSVTDRRNNSVYSENRYTVSYCVVLSVEISLHSSRLTNLKINFTQPTHEPDQWSTRWCSNELADWECRTSHGRYCMSVECWWQGKPKFSEKNLFQSDLVNHKSYIGWPGTELPMQQTSI
jgi:hypothetical protein